MNNELFSKNLESNESKIESTLRPKSLGEFIGQQKLKANLKVFIQAAKNRKDTLDHVLFYGPPGLGKTTLANIISKELQTNLKSTSGPVLEKVGDLASILTDLSPGDVLFIDEIHRMNHAIEEALYPALEDFKLDIIIGQGPSAKSIKLDLSKFTLVGTTTRAGMLTGPLRDRFGITHHLDFYTTEELKIIIFRSAKILNIKIDETGCTEIAKRSRGTPRIANRILKRVRDFAEVSNKDYIDKATAISALGMLEIDSLGLNKMDRRILNVIIENYSGGPVGVETIAVASGEEVDTITDVYEPYLIQIGFLARTPRGRIATKHAYKHLKIN